MPKKDPNNHIIIGQIQSDTSDKTYIIGVDKKISEKLGTVHFTCDCRAFPFSGKSGVERHCKHTKNFIDLHFFSGGGSLDKILSKLQQMSDTIGCPVKTDPGNRKLVLVRVDPASLLLTKIVCPSIICSHMMIGKFDPCEVQSCEKCGRKFLT